MEAVSSILTAPVGLRRDLQTIIEQQRQANDDPAEEARTWTARLAEAKRKREKYQEMFAAEVMTLGELKAKLEDLEGTRLTAGRELASLARKCEELEAMEHDSALILESYATLAPEALDSLSPEERRRVYVILNLTVEALVDDSLKISGAFGEEPPVWESDRTSTR